MDHSLLKLLHMVGACVLLGGGVLIAFFTWFGSRHALRNGSIEALRHILRLTVIADGCFTATAVVAQPLTGWLLMRQLGWSIHNEWFAWVAALFLGIGLCWLPVVWIQWRLRNMALNSPDTQQLPTRFHHLFRIWFALGVPAFAMLLVILWLMVIKIGV